jgi:hypothetical protein
MRRRILEHGAALMLVGMIFIAITWFLPGPRAAAPAADAQTIAYEKLDFIDFDEGMDRALFSDSHSAFYPGKPDPLTAVDDYRRSQTISATEKYQGSTEVFSRRWGQFLLMFFKFVFTYVLVMAITYYGVQTLGLWRFINNQQLSAPRREQFSRHFTSLRSAGDRVTVTRAILALLRLAGRDTGRLLANLVLFAPAYVIAYSLRTRFDTDSFLFMIILGVVSNGLLIIYSQKFYTFLLHESRRGYTQTAVVKNLVSDWNFGPALPLKSVFEPVKYFPGHVLDHIYRNARYQFLATVREQAAFLITGLIIIEMALNIQGHLCYEMMQQILYHRYGLVLMIAFAIFTLVKLTDMLIDYRIHVETGRIENRAEDARER